MTDKPCLEKQRRALERELAIARDDMRAAQEEIARLQRLIAEITDKLDDVEVA